MSDLKSRFGHPLEALGCVLNPFKPYRISTIIDWTSPFRFKGCRLVIFIVIQILIEHFVSKQWRPWVCTVCLCSAKRTLSLYLISKTLLNYALLSTGSTQEDVSGQSDECSFVWKQYADRTVIVDPEELASSTCWPGYTLISNRHTQFRGFEPTRHLSGRIWLYLEAIRPSIYVKHGYCQNMFDVSFSHVVDHVTVGYNAIFTLILNIKWHLGTWHLEDTR